MTHTSPMVSPKQGQPPGGTMEGKATNSLHRRSIAEFLQGLPLNNGIKIVYSSLTTCTKVFPQHV